MKTLQMLFIFGLAASANANAEMTTPYMFKDEAAAVLKARDLEVISVLDDATIYTGDRTSSVQLLVSKGGFKSQPEAVKFCANHKGFELANTTVIQYVLQTRLPFPELWPVSFIQQPLLFSRDGLSTGAVLWFKLSPEQKLAVALRSKALDKAMANDDYIFVAASLDDRALWGLQPLSEINDSLRAIDVPSVNVPAICVTSLQTLEP